MSEDIMDRWALERKRQHAHMLALVTGILEHMPGWELMPLRDNNDDGTTERQIRQTAGPLVICLTIQRQHSKKQERLIIGPWFTWPQFTQMERGEEQTRRITVRDLRDPAESSPDITVATARGGAAIAGEILKRLLPEYERLWKRCEEKADEEQRRSDSIAGAWREVCAIGGGSESDTSFAPKGLVSGDYSVMIYQTGGTKARLTADLTPEHVALVLAALRKPEPEPPCGLTFGLIDHVATLSQHLHGTRIAVALDGQFVQCQPGELPRFDMPITLWINGPVTSDRIIHELITARTHHKLGRPYTGIIGEEVRS